MAEVEPRFEKLNGHDPLAIIVSANLNRRNLTKGQQAMALAMIYPEPERGRGKTDDAKKGAETASFSYRRVQEARSILRHSRALAEQVVAGSVSLDAALEQVRKEQEESASAESQMAALRRHAPDLAEMVEDERLTLAAGLTELRQRQQKARQLSAGLVGGPGYNEPPIYCRLGRLRLGLRLRRIGPAEVDL